MKIFKERRLNKWYQSLNVKKVSELTNGTEIILTTEDKVFFNGDGEFTSNKFAYDFADNILKDGKVHVLSEKPNLDTIAYSLLDDSIKSSDIYLGTSLNDMKYIRTISILGVKDEFNYVSIALDERLINNIKSKYADDDTITFEVVTLGERTDATETITSKVLCFYIEKVDAATEEKIIELYKLVAKKLIERYHLLKCLREGYKITDLDNIPFVAKESDYPILDDLIMLGNKIFNECSRIEDYPESYKIIEEYFKSRDTVVESTFFGALDIYNDDNKLAPLLPVIFS